MDDALTAELAEAIWTILVEEAGASADLDKRRGFVMVETRRRVDEYRFVGHLGFGGKFWRNPGTRPDGSWGERWYVNCYREDETPERKAAIARTNDRLWDLQRRTP